MIPNPYLGLAVMRIVTSVVNFVMGIRNSEEAFRFTSCFLAALDSLILTLAILSNSQ